MAATHGSSHLPRLSQIEPALNHLKNEYAGAVYSENDQVGDSLEFTRGLAQWLTLNREIEFKLNTTVQKIVTRGRKLAAVETDQGTLQADAVVVCMGAWSNKLAGSTGYQNKHLPDAWLQPDPACQRNLELCQYHRSRL